MPHAFHFHIPIEVSALSYVIPSPRTRICTTATAPYSWCVLGERRTDEFSHPQPLTVPLPIDIDVEELSSLIPEVSFTTPTPETIVSLYRLILTQVAETNATQMDLEEARAEVERRKVELDQAYQDAENKTKSLESSLGNSQLTVARQEKE
ncbi:hypothetical protein BDR03DRAFT_975403 [Suillus americanus]|nr:hypothetical protein BDR03DRAFT_975403 [Suillus americanus]